MTSIEAEGKVYDALSTDAELKGAVTGMYHYLAPSEPHPKYPILVYLLINDSPSMAGDDMEVTHKVIMRVQIVTGIKRSKAEQTKRPIAVSAVIRIMEGLGYTRRHTITFEDSSDGTDTVTIDFVKNLKTKED